MLVAQITDLHIGFKSPDGRDPNLPRFQKVLQHLNSLIRQPDLVILSGDLTEDGSLGDFQALKSEIKDCPWPVFMALGNHDLRNTYRQVFKGAELSDGFLQYAFDHGEYRFIVLDTLLDGKHRAGFCKKRASWLDQALSDVPNKPTIIVLHHPPVLTQITWMSMPENAEWAQRLKHVVERHDHVIHLMAGHVHRPISAQFSGRPLSIAPAIASETALELAELDPDKPDHRPMIIDSAPGYALHYYSGHDVITHFGYVTPDEVLVRYDEKYHWLPKLTMDMIDSDKAG